MFGVASVRHRPRSRSLNPHAAQAGGGSARHAPYRDPFDELRSGLESQTQLDTLDVGVDGLRLQGKLPRDLGVAQPIGNKQGHVELSGGQSPHGRIGSHHCQYVRARLLDLSI